MDEKSDSDGIEYIGYKQLAEMLGVKVATIYSWVSRRVVPYVRVGPRVVRFRRADIDKWLEERSVSPVGSAREP